MKTESRFLIVAMTALAFLLAAASASAVPDAAKVKKTKTVKVKVKKADSAPTLEMKTFGVANGCSLFSGNGCIEVERGESADLVFELPDQKAECAPGKPWRLTGFQLGGLNSPDKPQTWGDAGPEATADFSADADGWAAITTAENTLTVYNENDYAYEVWYRLRASCEGVEDIYSDPVVRNKGR